MTKTFTGAVMLPGEAGNGLEATLSLDPERVTLTAGDSQLGSWDRADYLITPESNGSFGLTLGGETLVFRPDSPSEFSSTSAVPMAEPLAVKAEPKPKSKSKSKSKSKPRAAANEDSYINAAIANIRPLSDPNDDGGLSKGFVTIMTLLAVAICIAAVVTAALV
ncbi:MAG: hypothetical protein WBO84_03895 [Acidimicrobiia bacterium]